MSNLFKQNDATDASFLPADYVTKKAEMRANALSLVLFGMVMFAVVGAFFVTNRQWHTVRKEQQAISQAYSTEAKKIDQLKQLETHKVAMLAKAEVTTALLERIPRSVLLAELIARMPEGITLLELNLESKRIKPPKKKTNSKSGKTTKVKRVGSLTDKAKLAAGKKDKAKEVQVPRFVYTLKLVGVATENNNIADYLTGLQGCPLLNNVELRFIQDTKIGDARLRKFEIKSNLNNNADGRHLEPESGLILPDGAKLSVVEHQAGEGK